MRRMKFDHSVRWRVMFKGPRDRRWVMLGSVGSHDQAMRWLTRFFATGDFRIEKPTTQEVTTHGR